MSWTQKSKTSQTIPEEYLLSSDGSQILVGSDEDQVLLLRASYTNWTEKSKNSAGSWNLKDKIVS